MSEISLLNKVLTGVNALAVFFVLMMALQFSDLKYRLGTVEYQLEKLAIEKSSQKLRPDTIATPNNDLNDRLQQVEERLQYAISSIGYVEMGLNDLQGAIHTHDW